MTGALRRFRDRDGYEQWLRWSEWPLVVLGLLFVVVLVLPLAQPLTDAETKTLQVANIAIWAVFAADYGLRLYLVRDRRIFVRTHVLDLIAIAVPFLRPLRLIRLLAIVISTSRRAGGLVVRRVTLYVLGVAVIVLSVGAVVIYDAERRVEGSNIHTLGDAFWWATTTVTTVGYGDRYPVTETGRLVALVLMVTGIALVGTITATVAAWFVQLVRTGSDQIASDERSVVLAEVRALHGAVASLHEELAALRKSLGEKTL